MGGTDGYSEADLVKIAQKQAQLRLEPEFLALHPPGSTPVYLPPATIRALQDQFWRGCFSDDVTDLVPYMESVGVDTTLREQELAMGVARATEEGNRKVMEHLLSHGASLRLTSPFRATRSRSKEILGILLESGWDINQQDNGGGSTLLECVCSDETFLRWCIEVGANPNIPEQQRGRVRSDNHLLDYAAATGCIDTFKFVRSVTTGNGHPLHYAAQVVTESRSHCESRMRMVEYLIDEYGCDVNDLDTPIESPWAFGTPLHYAIAHSYVAEEIVRFLLKRGASPFIPNCWGSSAMDVVKSHAGTRMLDLFNQHLENPMNRQRAMY